MARQLLFLFGTLLFNVCAYDIHKHMTIDELRSTFHVEDHDLVPEYEIIHLHHIGERSIENNPSINTLENSIQGETNSKFTKTKDQEKFFEKFPHKEANIRLKAFGKHLNLSLTKNSGLLKTGGLKLWSVEPNATAQHGIEYVEIPETEEEIGDVFQDEQNEAAFLIRRDNQTGALVVEGSIGSDLIIRPMPIRLHPLTNPNNVDTDEELNQTTEKATTTILPQSERDDDDEMFLDEDGELSSEVAIDTGLPIRRNTQNKQSQGHQHIVYRRKGPAEETLSDYAFMEPDHLAKRYRRNAQNTTSNRSKREAPYIIYPEILVIVDYDGYRLHGGDNVQIKRYFISFWNGVDLRYKLLKGPRVRISIAGIIISRGRDATPYLERNRVGRDAIDSAAALTDMGKYLFRERRLPVYDIAVAITKLDMCRRQYTGDVCNRGTAGFAYVGGACVVNKRLEKVNSVAIIEDTGGFSGIIVAAHEVGHLLGAVHDGSPPPSYLGGPGAEKCQWTDGYIMSDLRHTDRGFRWSSCSISSFHHFLNGDTATCLFNAPHEDDGLPRVLPGKLLSLDAQCRRDRGTSACFKDDRVCAQLFCFDSGSGYCVAYRPAAEGSPCGDGQYCLNGRCVVEHENIIPDYSQNTPSYLRRDQIQGRPLFHEEDEDLGETVPPDNHIQTTPPPYPHQYQYESPETTQTPYVTSPKTYTTSKPFFFSFSTSKPQTHFSKYFHTTKSITSRTYSHQTNGISTTHNPYVGKFYELQKQTTINPYDFANFAKRYQDINNNYLKRSYNVASYYDSSNVQNTQTNPQNGIQIGVTS
uniref:Peptidase M12B domain-containing protein n=5 Tax=Photinus pyralis TaxID=7054 RepID=A0A1Y1MQZ3_PHOPY